MKFWQIRLNATSNGHILTLHGLGNMTKYFA